MHIIMDRSVDVIIVYFVCIHLFPEVLPLDQRDECFFKIWAVFRDVPCFVPSKQLHHSLVRFWLLMALPSVVVLALLLAHLAEPLLLHHSYFSSDYAHLNQLIFSMFTSPFSPKSSVFFKSFSISSVLGAPFAFSLVSSSIFFISS